MTALLNKFLIFAGGLLWVSGVLANIRPVYPQPSTLVEISKQDAKDNKLPPLNIKVDYGEAPVSVSKFASSSTYLKLTGLETTIYNMGMTIDATTKSVETDSEFRDYVKSTFVDSRDLELGELETADFKGKSRKMIAIEQGETATRKTTCVILYAPQFQPNHSLIVTFSVARQDQRTCSAVFAGGAFNPIVNSLLITQ